MEPSSPPRKIKDLCNPIIENPIHIKHQSGLDQSRKLPATAGRYGHSITDLLNSNDVIAESAQVNPTTNFINGCIDIGSANLSNRAEVSAFSSELPPFCDPTPAIRRQTLSGNEIVENFPQESSSQHLDQRNDSYCIDTLKLDSTSKVQTSIHKTQTKQHPCSRCARVFNRKADAEKHISVVHDRIKNFICIICGRRFGRKDYLVVSAYFIIIRGSLFYSRGIWPNVELLIFYHNHYSKHRHHQNTHTYLYRF